MNWIQRCHFYELCKIVNWCLRITCNRIFSLCFWQCFFCLIFFSIIIVFLFFSSVYLFSINQNLRCKRIKMVLWIAKKQMSTFVLFYFILFFCWWLSHVGAGNQFGYFSQLYFFSRAREHSFRSYRNATVVNHVLK